MLDFSTKINNLALKIFASIPAVILDIITIPIRSITTLFRNNSPEETHSMINLINKDATSPNNYEVVKICYELRDVKMEEVVRENEDEYQDAVKSVTTGVIRVALQRLPGEKGHITKKNEGVPYNRKNDEWFAGVTTMTFDSFDSCETDFNTFEC